MWAEDGVKGWGGDCPVEGIATRTCRQRPAAGRSGVVGVLPGPLAAGLGQGQGALRPG